MSKIISKFDPDVVIRAVNRIADPVIQTITPLGNNVLFEKGLQSNITNDGATIAKLIDSEDEVEDAIIQMVKYGSLATNAVAGDGTSTTILYIKSLVSLGLRAIKDGVKPMLLKKVFDEMRNTIIENAESLRKDVTNDDLLKIATISASGDEKLAANVVEIISTAGLDGMVFLNDSKNQDTRIIKDTGYNLEQAMFNPVLGNIVHGSADYQGPSVFVTDKKLYHVEECKEILEKAYENGVVNLVIVARDFLGESASFLIANHVDEKVPLNILLIKYPTPDNDYTGLYDLAKYLGGDVVSEKRGSLKDKLNKSDFIFSERVYSKGPKTIFVSSVKANPELTFLIEDLRKKKEELPEDTQIAKRLASLTAGTVSVEVGAPTGPEMRELIFKYEDAVNATRAALRSGYVVGGGVTLYQVTRSLDWIGAEFGESSVRQIAMNCGVDFDASRYEWPVGFNARTGEYSNLEEDGVIEPFDVFKHSILNAFSIATAILTSGYIIVNKVDKDKDK